MKKILLIGNFTDIYSDINEYLSKEYQIQMSPFDLKSVEGITKIAKPDLILICMVGAEKGNEMVFELLNEKRSHIPVLVIVSKEGLRDIRDYCVGERYHILHTPCKNREIMDACKDIISPIPYVDNENEQVLFGGAALVKSRSKRKKNILVVDDTAMMLRNIKEMLKSQFDVTLSKSGKAALEIIAKDMPDLVLLDYDMPEMDGSETFKKIKEMVGNSIPVIFLTGVTGKDKIIEVLKDKPAGYILKPPDRDMLIKKIEDALKNNE